MDRLRQQQQQTTTKLYLHEKINILHKKNNKNTVQGNHNKLFMYATRSINLDLNETLCLW